MFLLLLSGLVSIPIGALALSVIFHRTGHSKITVVAMGLVAIASFSALVGFLAGIGFGWTGFFVFAPFISGFCSLAVALSAFWLAVKKWPETGKGNHVK